MILIGLIDTIKKCQKEQLNQMQPTNIHIGIVTSKEPLEIEIDQKYILTEEFLILTRNVTEHEIEMTVDHETKEHTHNHGITVADTYTGGGEATSEKETHLHKYKGKKVFLVHKGLEEDEKVVLIKVQGGQKYFVIDRLGV